MNIPDNYRIAWFRSKSAILNPKHPQMRGIQLQFESHIARSRNETQRARWFVSVSLLALFLASGTASGQSYVSGWDNIQSGTDADLFTAEVHEGTIWAFGASGVMVSSSDEGLTWKQVESPTTSDLIDSDSAFGSLVVAGDGGIVLLKKDIDAPWQDVSVSDGWSISGIALTGSQSFVVVGSAGSILQYDGESWTDHSIEGGEDLRDISFLDSELGIISGGSGTLLASTDGGSSWEPRDAPEGATDSNIVSIDFYSKSRIYAVSDEGQILISARQGDVDVGFEWNLVEIESENGSTTLGIELYELDVLSTNKIIFAGPGGYLSLSKDGGNIVTQYLIPMGDQTVFNDVAMINAYDGVAVGNGGVILWARTDSGEDEGVGFVIPDYGDFGQFVDHSKGMLIDGLKATVKIVLLGIAMGFSIGVILSMLKTSPTTLKDVALQDRYSLTKLLMQPISILFSIWNWLPLLIWNSFRLRLLFERLFPPISTEAWNGARKFWNILISAGVLFYGGKAVVSLLSQDKIISFIWQIIDLELPSKEDIIGVYFALVFALALAYKLAEKLDLESDNPMSPIMEALRANSADISANKPLNTRIIKFFGVALIIAGVRAFTLILDDFSALNLVGWERIFAPVGLVLPGGQEADLQLYFENFLYVLFGVAMILLGLAFLTVQKSFPASEVRLPVLIVSAIVLLLMAGGYPTINAVTDGDGDGWSDLDEPYCDSDPNSGLDSLGNPINEDEDLNGNGEFDVDTYTQSHADSGAIPNGSEIGDVIPGTGEDLDGDGRMGIASVPTDYDGDGICDSLDSDDDNDGIIDSDDTFPMNPKEGTDLDGNGIGDEKDSQGPTTILHLVFLSSLTFLVGWIVNRRSIVPLGPIGTSSLVLISLLIVYLPLEGDLFSPLYIDVGLSQYGYGPKEQGALMAIVGTAAFGTGIAIDRKISLNPWSARPLNFIATAYTDFFRNTPLIVQFMFIHFGLELGKLIQEPALEFFSFENLQNNHNFLTDIVVVYGWEQCMIDSLTADALLDSTTGECISDPSYGKRLGGILNDRAYISAIFALGLNSAAYQCETIRGAIAAIPSGQMEAGRSIGLNYMQTMGLVIMPQAIRICIPPLGNEMVNLVLNSSLAMVIGYAELTRQGKLIIAVTFQLFWAWGMVMISYFVVTWTLALLLRRLEEKTRIPGLGISGGA